MKNADDVAEEWLRVWQYINNAMHQQKMLLNQQQSEVESERDSTESSCTDKNRAHSNVRDITFKNKNGQWVSIEKVGLINKKIISHLCFC